MSSQITIALSKGRILKDTLPLLKAAGIELAEDPGQSRKLIIPTTHPDVNLLIVRASDVPTYVEYGAADIGVAGKDVLLEHGSTELYEPLDLNIARCKLMTAGKVGVPEPEGTYQSGDQVRQSCQTILCFHWPAGRYHQTLRFNGAGTAGGAG